MTCQGDQQNIVSESGSAEDGLVSGATSTTAVRGLSCTARRGLSLCTRVPTLPEGCPRNFGSEMPNAMARGSFFRVLAVLLIFRFIFGDLLFFRDKSALLYNLCFP